MKLKLMANAQLVVAVGVDVTTLDIRRRLCITAGDPSCRFLQELIQVSDYNTGDNEWREGSSNMAANTTDRSVQILCGRAPTGRKFSFAKSNRHCFVTQTAANINFVFIKYL